MSLEPSSFRMPPAASVFLELFLKTFPARGLHGRRRRMRTVQIPLLRDTDHAAGENIHCQAAGNRRNHEDACHGDRHDFHHHLLLGVGRGHGCPSSKPGTWIRPSVREGVERIARGKVHNPQPGGLAHLDGVTQRGIQPDSTPAFAGTSGSSHRRG